MEGNNAKSDRTDNFESKGNDIQTEKKHRHREKKVIADLIKQIEFYFSDPNLQKDRFLRQKISESENGSFEIETIANFNRMKQLCGDISLVVKAMKRCSSIEVIDEKWLKLLKPLPEPKNVDLQTIYVEGLPSNAEHKWLKSLFSSCGNVVYVSLPRHKLNKKIKGFAFVEFENESEADAALKMFADNSIDQSSLEEGPDMLTVEDEEIDKFSIENSEKKKKRKCTSNDSDKEKKMRKKLKSKHLNNDDVEEEIILKELEQTKTKIEKDNAQEICKKTVKKESENGRKISGNNEDSNEQKTKKRKRTMSEDSEHEATLNKKNKQMDKGDNINEQEFKNDVQIEEKHVETKMKKRKRTKKVKDNIELEKPKLRVISKMEWLKLKNEYRQLQKQAMKDAKQKLKIEFEEKNLEVSTSEVPQRKIKDKVNCKAENDAKDEKKLPEKLERQNGVVLRFISNENVDSKEVLDIFSTITTVAYLEMNDNKKGGYVRFPTKEMYEKVVETFSKSDGCVKDIKIEKLSEYEDKEYWERLNIERSQRFMNKKKRKKNTRGRQKE